MPAACCCLFLLLDEKEPKNQGRLHRTSPRPSKGLTLRSRSTFCEGKRQAPLREGQALSRPLRALPRPAALPPRPARWGVGVPAHGKLVGSVTPTDITHALFRHCGLDPQSPKPPEDYTLIVGWLSRFRVTVLLDCFVVPPRNDVQCSRCFDTGNMNAVHGIGVPGHGVHEYVGLEGMSYRARDEGAYLCLRLVFFIPFPRAPKT